MGPVRIGVGTEWWLDQRAFRVLRQPSTDRFAVLDLKFNLERDFSSDEILAHYSRGELKFIIPADGTARPNRKLRKQHDLRDLTKREKELLEKRWKAIEPLTRFEHKPTQQDFRERIKELRRSRFSLSVATLRRYWHAWKHSGGDRRALVPKTRQCGGRGQSRKHSLLKKFLIINRLVEDAIRDVYLTMARRPISAITSRVLEDLQRLNARLPANQATPVPKGTTLARAIARKIKQIDPWEVDRHRWGKRIADQRHKPTSTQRLATRILERVEIDHSPLKVLVGNEAGPIGQPWLTVLIDYYSRMIVGFCVGFDPPSYAVIMEALRQAILPKTYLAEKFPSIKGKWPCFGLPEKLVCDRGSDFTSHDLEEAAFQLGIELDFNPPRMPSFKGTVESFFGGLNDQLIATLPGRTFRSWEKRADYKPEDGPLLPYEALLEVIQVHLVDVYAQSKHPTIRRARLEVWEESAREFPPFLPATPEELVVLLSKKVERSLSSRGIELGGMLYNSESLMAIRPDLAALNLPTNALTVRYNPWNLGSIWILDPTSGQYIKANAVDSAMEGMTEYQWKVLKRTVRDRFDGPAHLANLAQGRNAIRDIVEQSLKKPSRKRKVKEVRFLQDHSDKSPTHSYDSASIDTPSYDPPPTPEKPSSQELPVENDSCDPIDPDELDVEDWGIASTDP